MPDEQKIESPITFSDQEHRVIVIFGDISGFRSWIRRVSTGQLKKTFPGVHLNFYKFSPGAFVYKDLGDGFMAVFEYCSGALAERLVQMGLDVATEIEKVRLATPIPRFSSFRIRFVCGDVNRWERTARYGREYDYIGYPVNLAFELLSVAPEYPVVVHESIVEMMADRPKEGLVLTKFEGKKKSREYDTVFNEDLKSLFRVEAKP